MGLLPCGAVYAMLVPAATLRSPGESATAMMLFGIGTMPALSVSHWLLWRSRENQRLPRHALTPVLMILAGCITLWRAW